MKNEKNQKKINPDEVVKWFNVFSMLVKFIKSVIGKKPNTKKKVLPLEPTIHIESDTLKNQNLNN
jgi:hypothetical protein